MVFCVGDDEGMGRGDVMIQMIQGKMVQMAFITQKS